MRYGKHILGRLELNIKFCECVCIINRIFACHRLTGVQKLKHQCPFIRVLNTAAHQTFPAIYTCTTLLPATLYIYCSFHSISFNFRTQLLYEIKLFFMSKNN